MLLLALRLLPLLLAVRRGGAVERNCSAGFSSNFVLDAEDSVKQGAVLLSTAQGQSKEECKRDCCLEPSCNLALMEPSGACSLFNCVYRNRFVCDSYQSWTGYTTYVTEEVYKVYLKAPPKPGRQRVIAIGGRNLVVQPGETVTLNGIESHSPGYKIKDYTWTLKSGDSSVTIEKTEFPDQVRVSGLQSGSYRFELKVTDSEGNWALDQIQILVLTPDQSGPFCLALPKVGPCRASFTRWRYDAFSGVCTNFTYGGCKGNDNNYLSKEACEQACRGVTASSERRGLPVTEVCGSQCQPDQLSCDATCCLHKSLECDGVSQCTDGADEQQCSQMNETFNRLLKIHLDPKKAHCTQPPRTGSCRASFTRWFFDPLETKCYSFTFGGCEANDNNHEHEDECNQYCTGVTKEDVYAPERFTRFKGINRDEDKEETKSGSVAVGLVLAVVVLALLALAAYCFLKKKKKQTHQPVSPTEI